jgi:hypothetical protein
MGEMKSSGRAKWLGGSRELLHLLKKGRKRVKEREIDLLGDR